jgi:hypothetical protein
MLKVICPDCNGAKSGFAISCSNHGCQTGMRVCDFCKGEGQVSSEAAERWRNGYAMRKDRIKRGLTVMQEAAILGVDPKLLSDVEFGRRPLEELNHQSS